MKIEDVKNKPRRERRTLRANLRLYPSQMKFIDDHELSIQAIFDKALEELGHKIPSPEEIEKISNIYSSNEHKAKRKVRRHYGSRRH